MMLERIYDVEGLTLPEVRIFRELADERARQDAKWGEQNHPDGTALWGDLDKAIAARNACDDAFRENRVTWRDILCEELNEALAESEPEKLREELIQVAAVAAAWVEAIDRRAA